MTTEMRILTVRQPWAWAIIHGGKDVENRARNIAGEYRGPVAIHVAKQIATSLVVGADPLRGAQLRAIAEGGASWEREPWWAEQGNIIGVVDLVEVHIASVIGGCGRMRDDCPEHGTCREHCSTWAMGPAPEGWFQHLVLKNPRPLSEPIPYRGALGLRRLNQDTITQVTAALAAEEGMKQ